jgi:IS30 family transposase
MGTIYSHLCLAEREEISVLKAQGKSIRAIAEVLKRSPSTISRELKTNAPPVHKAYYRGHKAHERATTRNQQSHQRPRLKNDVVRSYVCDQLRIGWSPEQIAGTLSKDLPGQGISYEAVYQYLYKEQPALVAYLSRSHKKRWKRGHSRKHRKTHIPHRVSIDQRPQHIEQRSQSGHWESDTVVSRQGAAALLVLVERKSRFTVIEKLSRKTAGKTKTSIVNNLQLFPQHLRRSITYDNGPENTEHESVNMLLGTVSYFCNPYHSWEKATVENTIGLIRRFFPKKTNFDQLTHKDIRCVEILLNKRPRKCLNYQTPFEVFAQGVALTG